MPGKTYARNLATKGAETKCLVPFCLELIDKYRNALTPAVAAAYKGIGESIMGLLAVMQSEDFVMRPASIQSMYDHLNRLYRLWLSSGLACKPKLHLLMHMCDRAHFQGNPAYYATWADESLNRLLASLGMQAHRSVCECRILCYFQQSQAHSSKRRRF
jgi:hypothetical protein